MKVLGLVEWTDRDKNGSSIAGVRPLIDLQAGDWRPINALDEFPSQGQVFWPKAQAATGNTLVVFRAEPNIGQKDEFRVVEPKVVYEVVDLRMLGNDIQVREALATGIQLPGPFGITRVLVWCKPDVLIGPIELSRTAMGVAKLTGTNQHRLPTYSGAEVRKITVDHVERLLRADETAPSGYVDWDDDAVVLRRAVEAAVRVAKLAGVETGQTKRQIEEAARALAAQGLGPEGHLDRYRLQRALTLIGTTDIVTQHASDLASSLREHPAVRASLDVLAAKVGAEVEQRAREDLEQRLARERATLAEVVQTNARTRSQLEATTLELHGAEQQLAHLRDHIASTSRNADAAVQARLRDALDRPLELLAEVGVLKPFLGTGTRPASRAATFASKLSWSGGEQVKDTAALRRALTSAARAHGVDPSLMLQLHATVAAGVMPITMGARALPALAAYAQGACGSRLQIVHVSPSAMHVDDFTDDSGTGLVSAVTAAKEIDGIALVALEGANRSPLEASLLPLLQVTEIGISPFASSPGIRLAAAFVVGATTVPVTPQLWSYGAAVYAEPAALSPQPRNVGDVSLGSELLALGDEPTGVIDALIDAWPACREVRHTMSRLGCALTRLYDDERRVTDVLLMGVVLPFIATSLTTEEQADAVDRVGDQDGSTADALRRLRRWLA